MKILLVEDNPIEAHALQSLIKEQGDVVSVDVVGTLEELQNSVSAGYDVALVDLNLPDATAEEMIEALRTIELPTMVITGTGHPEVCGQVGRKLGVSVMMKPTSRMDMESIARNVIGVAEFREEREREFAKQAEELAELRKLKIFEAVKSEDKDGTG